MTLDELKSLPKVELHCHLDGSLSSQFIQARLGRFVPESGLRVDDNCASLQEYLEKFALPGQCLTDEEGLFEAGYDVLANMSKENVCYAEIRFSPLLHVTEKMNVQRVIASLLAGLNKASKEFGIDYNVIICAMRHFNEEDNYNMIKASYEFLGRGVCAVDLAGAEASYPMSEFMNLFEKVRRDGMPFTIHAGECGSVKNILDSIEVGAKRIGHGIAMAGHSEVQALVKEKQIGIEMCPISNLQTKAVKEKSDYPIKEFINAGLLVTVNTDNRTVSNTTLVKELELIQKNYGITDEEVMLMMKNAIDVSFADAKCKEKLLKKISDYRKR